MKLTVHLTDRYVYLCENRPPRVGEHYIRPSNPGALFRNGVNEENYIDALRLIATDERLVLSNLSQSDADYIRSNGLKEVSVVTKKTTDFFEANKHHRIPKLTPYGNVIVVRESRGYEISPIERKLIEESVQHVFDSGVNEIRVVELVERFIKRHKNNIV